MAQVLTVDIVVAEWSVGVSVRAVQWRELRLRTRRSERRRMRRTRPTRSLRQALRQALRWRPARPQEGTERIPMPSESQHALSNHLVILFVIQLRTIARF